jgi:hypothetical protein
MAWVAACMERDGHTVDVARVGPGLFDATVRLVGGGEVFERVQTQLETGPRLLLTVEPVHPRATPATSAWVFHLLADMARWSVERGEGARGRAGCPAGC